MGNLNHVTPAKTLVEVTPFEKGAGVFEPARITGAVQGIVNPIAIK